MVTIAKIHKTGVRPRVAMARTRFGSTEFDVKPARFRTVRNCERKRKEMEKGQARWIKFLCRNSYDSTYVESIR
jgi:hypothetical protein